METTNIISFDLQIFLELVSNLKFNIQVFVGAIIIWIFSWLWHDFIIIKPWLTWTKMTIEDARALHEGKLNQDLSLYLVSKVILSYSCMILSNYLHVNTFTESLILTGSLSFGIVFTSGVGPVIFENRSVGLWMLSSSLISLSIFMLLIFQLVTNQFI